MTPNRYGGVTPDEARRYAAEPCDVATVTLYCALACLAAQGDPQHDAEARAALRIEIHDRGTEG